MRPTARAASRGAIRTGNRGRSYSPVGALSTLLAAVVAVAACNPSFSPSPRAGYEGIPEPPPLPSEEHAEVLVGAGDIAWCQGDGDEATAALLERIPGTVATFGDHAYPDGTLEQFAACYEPTWGRHLWRTRPSAGNHEYETRQARGYFEYFGTRAGEPGRGWYSYNLGPFWQAP